jgi:DNA-binding HxlR family transcriptional regulator
MESPLPDQVNGKQSSRVRAGGHALTLLASPMNVAILQALSEMPTPLLDLRRAVGMPPQTTMRKHLAALASAGILSRTRDAGFAGSVTYTLEKAGTDLLGVGRVVEAWLGGAPHEPIELGTVAAKSAIKALVEGWSTTLLRALAARPLTLTELDALLGDISYPSLERRLVAMRMAGQVEAVTAGGRGTPYTVTSWLRQAVGPLISSVCWERRHLAESTPPIGRLDIETSFLLALPVLSLDEEHSGSCRLTVDTRSHGAHRAVGAMVEIEEGQVVRCRARVVGEATASASGSVGAWCRAVGQGHSEGLEAGGDHDLVEAIVAGLHSSFAKQGTAQPSADSSM